jgi:AraC-like DNA-binding protein
MKSLSDIITLINFVGALQGIFLTIIILALRKKSAANKLLAVILLCFSLFTIGTIVKCTRFILYVPHLAETYPVLHFAFGPLLFFYIRALMDKNFKFQWHYLYHAIPFLLRVIYSIPFYTQSGAYKVEYIEQSYVKPPAGSIIIVILAFIQSFIYFVFAARVVTKSFKKHDPSNIKEHSYLRAVRNILIGLICLWVAWIVGYIASAPWFGLMAPLLFSILVYSLAYVTIYHPHILKIRNEEEFEIQSLTGLAALKQKAEKFGLFISYSLNEKMVEKKYNKSGLPEKMKDQNVKQLKYLMQSKKVYLKNDLTLNDLAQSLSISPNHLSQVLNERLGQNFFDFVNAYRIEEIKKEFANPSKSHLTILAIALEAGFNSKAAFNVAFKKHTGVTPSEYKKVTDALINRQFYKSEADG